MFCLDSIARRPARMNQLKFPAHSAGCCLLMVLLVHAMAGTTHADVLSHGVFDAAGGPTASTGYRNLSVVAQSSPLGTATSTGYRNYPGFLHSVAAEGNLFPDYTVSLLFAGTGTGWVTSFPVGIQCNVNCSASFNAYFPVTLTPTADQYMIFSGWSGGGCTGTAPCTLVLSGATTVTATFDQDITHSAYVPGAVPGSGTYYPTLQTAYNAAVDGATVSAWAITYAENLNADQAKSIVLKGGYDQTYTSQIGYTTLDGSLTISLGKVTIDRIIIK